MASRMPVSIRKAAVRLSILGWVEVCPMYNCSDLDQSSATTPAAPTHKVHPVFCLLDTDPEYGLTPHHKRTYCQ